MALSDFLLNPTDPIRYRHGQTARGIEIDEPNLNLTGASAILVLQDSSTGASITPFDTLPATITQTNSPAKISFQWPLSPTLPVGKYVAAFQITYPNSSIDFTGSVLIYVQDSFSPVFDPIVVDNSNLLRVFRSSLIDYAGRIPVKGSWIVPLNPVLNSTEQSPLPNTALVFVPTEPYQYNSRYTVEVDSRVQGADGQHLDETMRFSFVSWYKPFHCDPYGVRQRLGEHSARISDEDLYYYIWRASIRCNREMMWYYPAGPWRGGPTDQQVIDFQTTKTMAMRGYVELEATIRLLEKLIGKASEDTGISESFNGNEVSTSPERIKSIEAGIKLLRKEWEGYFLEISFKKARPISVIKSSNRPPSQYRDRGYRPRQSF